VRSTSWEAEMFIPGETLRRAQDWIVERL
jgi:hypothetical protein